MQIEEKQPVQQQEQQGFAEYPDSQDEELSNTTWFHRVFRIAEKAASNSLGQYVIKKIDNVLWTIEKTSKWSLPPGTRVRNDSLSSNSGDPENSRDRTNRIPSPQPLIRPLPWIFFLPLLIALRCFRVAMSFGALILSKNPVTPYDIIQCVRIQRRRLRAVKFAGLRNMRIKGLEEENERIRSGQVQRKTILSQLVYILELILCKRNTAAMDTVVKCRVVGHSSKKRKLIQQKRGKRQLEESSEDENEDTGVMLDRLAAAEDISSDSSFRQPDSESTSDITISENESETDSILNKTMHENDPRFVTPKTRKSRSLQNSAKKASSARNLSQSVDCIHSNGKEYDDNDVPLAEEMQNGDCIEEESPCDENKAESKSAMYMNGGLNVKAKVNRNVFVKKIAQEKANNMVILEGERFNNCNGGSLKEPGDISEEASGESINTLPESQRHEVSHEQNTNNNSTTNHAVSSITSSDNHQNSTNQLSSSSSLSHSLKPDRPRYRRKLNNGRYRHNSKK